jgi:hypothetical protein
MKALALAARSVADEQADRRLLAIAHSVADTYALSSVMNSRRRILPPKYEAGIANGNVPHRAPAGCDVNHAPSGRIAVTFGFIPHQFGSGLPCRARCWHVWFTSISGLLGRRPALLGWARICHMHRSKSRPQERAALTPRRCRVAIAAFRLRSGA